MPSLDTEHKVKGSMASWADQMEHLDEGEDMDTLPPPQEVIDGKNKIVTEYKLNDNGKKVKIVRYYKIENRRVPQAVAQRKSWKKFGLSSNDPPGPNPATTIISEDIFMQFVGNRDESGDPNSGVDTEDDVMKKLQNSGKGMVQCRYCGMDHWSLKCPYKDKLNQINKDGTGPSAPDGQPQARTSVRSGSKLSNFGHGIVGCRWTRRASRPSTCRPT